ncbi:MAG: acetyl-CoA carboxylase biotin carboxyl carrier protein [Chloroflexaceae bacterium]|nr:acetyl-CoA carboxylase biotin carboxyl carrier protein [Chloroflexaceae bacterium]
MSEERKDTDDFWLSAVRELLHLIGHTDITEILIERHESRLHIKRGGTIPLPTMEAPAVPPVLRASNLAPLGSSPPQHHLHIPASAAGSQPGEVPDGYTILAPMVGMFYESPSPRDAPFVQEGDEIQAGDTVGIIEAMKIMNEIESEVGGRVVRILVKNAQPVEYGQPLMVIEPR